MPEGLGIIDHTPEPARTMTFEEFLTGIVIQLREQRERIEKLEADLRDEIRRQARNAVNDALAERTRRVIEASQAATDPRRR